LQGRGGGGEGGEKETENVAFIRPGDDNSASAADDAKRVVTGVECLIGLTIFMLW